MRKIKFIALCGLLSLAAGLILGPVHAQQSAYSVDLRGLSQAVQTLQDQQKTIAANQAKIDSMLGPIAENVRVARLYAARVK
jgi:hypothetical protein